VNLETTRRDFLRTSALAGAGVLIGACNTPENKPGLVIPSPEPNPQKATELRTTIHDFIEANPNDLSERAINRVFELEKQLYSATFGRPILPTSPQLITNESLIAKGSLPQEAPIGDAGIILVARDSNRVYDIVVSLFLSNPEVYDPSFKKLEVIDLILKHEIAHTQTKPQIALTTEKFGVNPSFIASRSRGLKWIGTQSPDPRIYIPEEMARFFDEANTQLFAEYVDDPTGKSDRYDRFVASPIHRRSLHPLFVKGAKEIRKIYQTLGISIKDVQAMHYMADPRSLLNLIDVLSKRQGISQDQSPSSMILTNIKGEQSPEADYARLEKLARKY